MHSYVHKNVECTLNLKACYYYDAVYACSHVELCHFQWEDLSKIVFLVTL